jgi:hypothetical protein
VAAVLGTATGCEVLRASKPQSIDGLEPRIRYSGVHAASKNPVDLPLRLDDAAASPTTPQGQHQ